MVIIIVSYIAEGKKPKSTACTNWFRLEYGIYNIFVSWEKLDIFKKWNLLSPDLCSAHPHPTSSSYNFLTLDFSLDLSCVPSTNAYKHNCPRKLMPMQPHLSPTPQGSFSAVLHPKVLSVLGGYYSCFWYAWKCFLGHMPLPVTVVCSPEPGKPAFLLQYKHPFRTPFSSCSHTYLDFP